MKKLFLTVSSFCLMAISLSACGSDEKTTVIHDRPVIVQQAPGGGLPVDVENACAHGYDNRTHSCY